MAESRVVERGMRRVGPPGQDLRAGLSLLSEQIRPGAMAHERMMAVSAGLSDLFPTGLQRGSVVSVAGPAALSLSIAVAVGPSQAGGWAIVVGVPSLGLVAAHEQGVALERLVLVSAPPPRLWPDVIVTAGEGAEIVIAAVPADLRAADVRRMQARLARSVSVLLVVGAEENVNLQPDLRITTAHPRWEGVERGAGRLLARRVDVAIDGRRAVRPRRRTLLLPGIDGQAGPMPIPTVVQSGESMGLSKDSRGLSMAMNSPVDLKADGSDEGDLVNTDLPVFQETG